MRGPPSNLSQNRLQHSVQISQHVVVPEPQHAIALRLKEPGSLLVLKRLTGVLSTEFQPSESAGAKPMPKAALGVRGVRAQVLDASGPWRLKHGRREHAGTAARAVKTRSYEGPPHPGPLPLKGERGQEEKIPLTLTPACTQGRGTISVPVPRLFGGAGRVRRLSFF